MLLQVYLHGFNQIYDGYINRCNISMTNKGTIRNTKRKIYTIGKSTANYRWTSILIVIKIYSKNGARNRKQRRMEKEG